MSRRLLLAMCVSTVIACGLSERGTALVFSGDASTGEDAGAADATTIDGDILPGNADGGTTDAGNVDGAPHVDASAPDSSLTAPIIYGITTDTLYAYDPNTIALTKIGLLTGCANMSDIAVNAAGIMFGTGTGLYTIDTTTGACTLVSSVAQPFTLTFVPKGTVNAASETLTAFLGSDYEQINQTTGDLTEIQELAINPYQPSGDIVSGEGIGTYVSVTDASCATDCLLQVNPTTGSILTNWGPTGSTGVLGLAESAGILYGFLDNGDIVQFVFGATTVTSTVISLPVKPAWIGAGSSTLQAAK